MPVLPQELIKAVKKLEANAKRMKVDGSVAYYQERVQAHLRKAIAEIEEAEDYSRFIPNYAGKWFPKSELRKAEK
jgi:hypothetical protein